MAVLATAMRNAPNTFERDVYWQTAAIAVYGVRNRRGEAFTFIRSFDEAARAFRNLDERAAAATHGATPAAEPSPGA